MENPAGDIHPIDIEKTDDRVLFEFNQEANSNLERLSVRLTVKDDERFPNIPPFGAFTVSKNGEFLAEVRGELQKNRRDKGIEFRAVRSHNFTKNLPYATHVPRLVGRTIWELVARGFVKRWYSDRENALSEDAIHLYGKFLAEDPRLEVIPPCPATENRYLVAAKPPISHVK